MNSKVILIIMDGWGSAKNPEVSAILPANTPFFDHSLAHLPNSRLHASEELVGLPAGQMGNSEVGHMNIGAGRIVFQDLVKISNEIAKGSIAENAGYRALVNYCQEQQKPLHLMGLLSDGGVHSHIDHLMGLIKLLAQEENFPAIYLHVFMDGRDTDPQGGQDYIKMLEAQLTAAGAGKIASVVGRYYAMDRDNNWDRVRKAYELLVQGKGEAFATAGEAVAAAYEQGITDEFIPASSIQENGVALATLQEGDAILFFNFRTDRGRELTTALTQRDFPEFGMHTVPLYYATMTRYDDAFTGVHVLYDKDNIRDGLGETLAKNGKQQIRIAETEKYPHVTFFFNGGREEPFTGEKRLLCPSPKVATYDLKPEMSAFEIRDKIIAEIEKEEVDFVCLNFANPDMVGHTGVWEAAIKACETVDKCTRQVVESALAHGYTVLVTADHGNVDCMRNPDGSVNTAHSTALVPLILHDPENRGFQLKDGKLGDLAPTILYLMGIAPPEAMNGNNLLHL
ncbi:MAG TPA: 2,3-bisphosphoglycerate-independent phosphoglycerate mutase [Bacteroidetes bacterium]|nr:2,3-bisphosphoglycerate-independent phosphoglycerate mutase [Bacteroidota bacterium]